jgi:hypothetical protein
MLAILKISPFLSCPAGVDLVKVTTDDTAGGGGIDKM